RSFLSKPKITSCRSTPFCGAARPTPSAACMVSNMSASKASSSALPSIAEGTGGAMRSKRGSPILRISWIMWASPSGYVTALVWPPQREDKPQDRRPDDGGRIGYLQPNTFFSRSVVRAAGLLRIDCTCSPTTVNRPSMLSFVILVHVQGIATALAEWPRRTPGEPDTLLPLPEAAARSV